MSDSHQHPDFQREDSAPPKRTKSEPPRAAQMILAALLLAALGSMIWLTIFPVAQTDVRYSFFLKQLEADNIKSVVMQGTSITGEWKKIPPNPDLEKDKNKRVPQLAERFTTEAPLSEEAIRTITDRLTEKDVEVRFIDPNPGLITQSFLFFVVPMLLILGIFMFLRRSSDPFGPGMFGSFIRSPAKRFKAQDQKTTFDDVAGMEAVKNELREIVEFLKDPAKFQRLGAQIPKGVLLNGPPGTGKTLLARAVAGEADVPYFSINGSEFIQMFVGVGASRVRDMFKTAKDSAPCILFIDEIDAVGRIRGAGLGGGHDEREQTLNQILSEMDGFHQTEAVIVLAATNRPDVLDPALLRPGRFDRHVTVDKPNREGRLGILQVHVRKVPLADDVDLKAIAGATIGFTGAELKNLVNEAALCAARNGKKQVGNDDFENARDKIMMGVPREEVLNDHERKVTAYHEAGHALLGWLQPEADPVHKVTIVPRGRALGVTQFLPEEERFHYGESRLRAILNMMLAGRAAEKLVFDEHCAGVQDDLKRASRIARVMVSQLGMSEKVGPVAFQDSEEHPFLGKEFHEQRHFSEETAHLIDAEMRAILVQAHDDATRMLNEHRSSLDKIAQALLEKEIIDFDDIKTLIGPPVDRSYTTNGVVKKSPD